MFAKSTSALSAVSLTKPSRTVVLAALVLALTAGAVDAQRRGRHYYRDIEDTVPVPESYAPGSLERGRFDGYRGRHVRRRTPSNILALVPADWRKEPPDPNWRGHRYVSPAGDASVAFYGRPAAELARDQYLKALAIVEGEEATYLRRERDWLVVFGFKGDKRERNFYRKVVLACGGRQWRHIVLEYPVEAKRSFERLIEGLSDG